MKILVTGSAGHLGEALVGALREAGEDVVGLDLLPSPTTTVVGTLTDRALVRRCMAGVHAVVHAATLHKPHVCTHAASDFVSTNVTGTLVLLEEATAAGAGAFVFTSTTSTFGLALTPGAGRSAAWVTEDVVPVPRNIYGVTKTAAEDLCQLFHQDRGLGCIILRVSRFFPEPDDRDDVRVAFDDLNLKVNELLYRRVDIQDVVDAHLLAVRRASEGGFGRYIISATTPFSAGDAAALGTDAAGVVRRLFPEADEIYQRRGWSMMRSIDRVYVNARARAELGWAPRYDFAYALDRLRGGLDPRSDLSLVIGAKGYHDTTTGIYTQRSQR